MFRAAVMRCFLPPHSWKEINAKLEVVYPLKFCRNLPVELSRNMIGKIRRWQNDGAAASELHELVG